MQQSCYTIHRQEFILSNRIFDISIRPPVQTGWTTHRQESRSVFLPGQKRPPIRPTISDNRGMGHIELQRNGFTGYLIPCVLSSSLSEGMGLIFDNSDVFTIRRDRINGTNLREGEGQIKTDSCVCMRLHEGNGESILSSPVKGKR